MSRLYAIAFVLALAAGSAAAQPYPGDTYAPPPDTYPDNPGYAPAPPPDDYYAPNGATVVGPVTVYAPSGPYRVHESRVVEAGDLDLSTPWGAQALRDRISDAAGDICRDLDRRYPRPGVEGVKCWQVATRHAMDDVVAMLGWVPPTWPDEG
ncbi:MAG: UrcA family protein [Caulobacteraceae bacterium]